ncbi:MAG TPA: rod shape-determining protein MreC [Noviherbaspirillum sp.]
MEYSPPPLFKQGASARAKLVFFSLIALILLVADSRMRSLGPIRQAVGTVLYPLQVVALMPRDAAYAVGSYFSTVSSLQQENKQMRQARTEDAVLLQQAKQLVTENAHLRTLLDASERLPVKSVMSEILYDARDAFTRKIVLDRGTQHGVALGQPVIDALGVVGQVTRVFPFTAEVTLLTDKDQAIPVQIVRSGLRSIAYGQGRSGTLDLRFMPVNADIRNGDVLVTSGLDGVYPAGLAVAKVTRVETKSNDAFARIICEPLAGIDRNRQLLILLTPAGFPKLAGQQAGEPATGMPAPQSGQAAGAANAKGGASSAPAGAAGPAAGAAAAAPKAAPNAKGNANANPAAPATAPGTLRAPAAPAAEPAPNRAGSEPSSASPAARAPATSVPTAPASGTSR